ncbi:MAG: hypothetical protein J2O48_01420 [Solirubrobacterales bacterium]|nr:hypothetical protein [Solirubrobacterales bacterium]
MYSIFDNGNLVVSFDTSEEAESALTRIAAEESQPTDTLMLIAFNDSGHAIAGCVPGESLPDLKPVEANA